MLAKVNPPSFTRRGKSLHEMEFTQENRTGSTYWKDSVAIVTGGASGIGLATAKALLDLGSSVCIVDIADELPPALSHYDNVMYAKADVSNEQEVAKAIELCVSQKGYINLAFNCAGIEGNKAPISETSVDDFDRVMSVNVRGIFLCLKYEIQHMLKHKEKEASERTSDDSSKSHLSYAIVNCSSGAGHSGMPEFSAYCASKHAILGLTKTASGEVGKQGIRVSAVCPTTTETPMVDRFTKQWPEWQAKQNASLPLGRVCQPEEVAAAVIWLLGPGCTYMSGSCMDF